MIQSPQSPAPVLILQGLSHCKRMKNANARIAKACPITSALIRNKTKTKSNPFRFTDLQKQRATNRKTYIHRYCQTDRQTGRQHRKTYKTEGKMYIARQTHTDIQKDRQQNRHKDLHTQTKISRETDRLTNSSLHTDTAEKDIYRQKDMTRQTDRDIETDGQLQVMKHTTKKLVNH